MTNHLRRNVRPKAGFTLVELVIVVTVLGMLAKILVETSDSMSRITATGSIQGQLQQQGEKALRSMLDDLRRSGFQTIDFKDYPYVFEGGQPGHADFAAHAYQPGPQAAGANDSDFGPPGAVVFVLPSDRDSDGRPELDADFDGAPELDGDRDGVYTDDPSDLAGIWDPNVNTIHPDTGVVWSHDEVSYLVVRGADGVNVLQRRINNNPNTARVIARNVERVHFDTPVSSGWTIPLNSVRVRIFFRVMDSDGREHRSFNEVVVGLRNGQWS